MLFREQGITIAIILTATGIAISVLVKVLLPSGDATAQSKCGRDNKLENVKEWIRNKLRALASLPGTLGTKAAETLSDIIGAIISWILNGLFQKISTHPMDEIGNPVINAQ